MVTSNDKTVDILCAAIALKERKKSLYDEAMKSCPDAVGVETFRMLKARRGRTHRANQRSV